MFWTQREGYYVGLMLVGPGIMVQGRGIRRVGGLGMGNHNATGETDELKVMN